MTTIPEDILSKAEIASARILDEALLMQDGSLEYREEVAARIIAEVIASDRPTLQPIETAPDLERIMVACWQKPSGRTAGYWWFDEGIAQDGRAVDRLNATHWFPIVLPAFPGAPKGGE